MKFSKLGLQTFIALIIGFLILFSSASFIGTSYWRLTRSQLTPDRLSRNIVRIVTLARLLPPDKAPQIIRLTIHPGIAIHFTRKTPQGLMPIYHVSTDYVRHQVLKNPNNVRLSFPLSDNLYMHVRTHIVRPLTLKLQFLAAFLVWLMALIGFCYYIVRRLSMPLASFIEGANRFSLDINAPPIPETGPKAARHAFKAFNRMQGNLKQLLQDRTQMLAAISHDLKTPLTRLSLRVENLKETETSAKMHNDLTQMQSMIDSILAFARDDYQHETVSQINLNALVDTICDDMQEVNKPVQCEETEERIICFGRPMALRRAIENLINNGIKYGDKVKLQLKTQHDFALISITDFGPGIADAEIEKVFLPFYRVDKARSSEQAGSGLGLATARDIIRSHGGDIQLQNLSPQGLQAIIKLPLQ